MRWTLKDPLNIAIVIGAIVYIVVWGGERGHWPMPFLPHPTNASQIVDEALDELIAEGGRQVEFIEALRDHRPSDYRAFKNDFIAHMSQFASDPEMTEERAIKIGIEYTAANTEFFEELVWGPMLNISDTQLSKRIEIERDAFEFFQSNDVSACADAIASSGAAWTSSTRTPPKQILDRWESHVINVLESPKIKSVSVATDQEIKAWRSDQPEKFFNAIRAHLARPSSVFEQRVLCNTTVDLYRALSSLEDQRGAYFYRGIVFHPSLYAASQAH